MSCVRGSPPPFPATHQEGLHSCVCGPTWGHTFPVCLAPLPPAPLRVCISCVWLPLSPFPSPAEGLHVLCVWLPPSLPLSPTRRSAFLVCVAHLRAYIPCVSGSPCPPPPFLHFLCVWLPLPPLPAPVWLPLPPAHIPRGPRSPVGAWDFGMFGPSRQTHGQQKTITFLEKFEITDTSSQPDH